MRSNIARTCPASSVRRRLLARVIATRYFNCERKATTASNFCGGRFLNEGIGAVGLTSVRAIAWRGQARGDVRQFRSGAVVAVIADLVARQAARLGDHRLPASYSASVLPPASSTCCGVGISIAVGDPALAPW